VGRLLATPSIVVEVESYSRQYQGEGDKISRYDDRVPQVQAVEGPEASPQAELEEGKQADIPYGPGAAHLEELGREAEGCEEGGDRTYQEPDHCLPPIRPSL
jgi:hypothetical protein